MHVPNFALITAMASKLLKVLKFWISPLLTDKRYQLTQLCSINQWGNLIQIIGAHSD